MSVNKERPHLLVIPEDDANVQLANGFQLRINREVRQFQVLPAVGGWSKVIESLNHDHLAGLRKYASRRVLLLLDFDDDPGRYERIQGQIPEDLCKRVFLLGVWSEPEKLKPYFGNLESIGERLALECSEGSLDRTWAHELLKHNRDEAQRLRAAIGGMFF